MAITLEKLKDTRAKVRSLYNASNGTLRQAYWDILRELNADIDSREAAESGEPSESGCEDYLGIEDR